MKYFVLFLVLSVSQINLNAQKAQFTNTKPSVAESPLVKLKTTLLKNLIDDGQIEDTNKRVEIEFKHDQILLEQEPISYELFEKYHFLMKGMGFPSAERYVVSLKSDYISLRAYDRTGKMKRLMIDAGEGDTQL
ncbi:MAG: hypothetical protein AAF806_01035 [Bacteroidota bacterium]